jgi:hypothetical protein
MQKLLKKPEDAVIYGLHPQTIRGQLCNVLKVNDFYAIVKEKVLNIVQFQTLMEPYGNMFLNRDQLAPLLSLLSSENDPDTMAAVLRIFSSLNNAPEGECFHIQSKRNNLNFGIWCFQLWELLKEKKHH